jgi:cobalt-zinc-cadmium efflux system outer membrane protein
MYRITVMHRWQLVSLATSLTLSISSCTKLPRGSEGKVARLIKTRIEKEVHWHQSCFEDKRIRQIIQAMVCQELSVDMAVQVAFLNNPRIQEAFEEIGIAQADLIEAGLLSNPVFEGFIRYSDRKELKINTEISVMQNFLDIFLIPLKTRIATAELQQAILETSNKIIELSFDVEKTYYELVAAYKKRNLIKMFIEIAEIENQISLAQKKVGNINKLEQQLRTAQYLEKTVELVDAEKEIIQLREKLNKLMGLTGCDSYWSVEQELPYIQDCEPSLQCLELIAFNERLDIQAARWEVERFRRFFPTAKGWAFTQLQAGVSSERDIDGTRVTGPQFSAALPIFNVGQGVKRRFLAQFRQAQDRLIALEIEAYAEVREARDLLLVFRNQLIFYAGRVLPNQEQILNLTEELYNVMGTGVFDLLDNKRNQIQAYLNYYLALKDYWTARVELDKSVGGKLYLIGSAYQENQECEGGTL